MEFFAHPAFHRYPVKTMVRAGLWPIRCACARSITVRYRNPDFVLRVAAKFRGGGGTTAYIFREFYEPEYTILNRLLEPGMVFVDVGANAGAFSLAAAKLVGNSGCVLAFEPGPNCFQLLCDSVERNKLGNLHVFDVALTNQIGEAVLFMHYGKENSLGLGAGDSDDITSYMVKTTTLAAVCRQQNIDRIDVMKMDVEGAQQLVMEGGMELIERCRPILLIKNNIGACRRLGLDPETAFDMVRRIGYQFAEVNQQGAMRAVENPGQTHHVFCVAEESISRLRHACAGSDDARS